MEKDHAVVLSIQEISGDTLQQLYDWESEYFPQQQPRAEYLAKLSQPRWTHFGIHKDGALVACLSVEAWDAVTWEAHVSVKRRAITTAELTRCAQALIKSALNSGIQSIFALIPTDNRAACRFARQCGMRPVEPIEPFMKYEVAQNG